jgi:23S rRNA pseudouridine1911/1915/1917 synthase
MSLQKRARDATTEAMSPPKLDVLYEDNHLLAVNKPAGLPTMGALAGRPSLVDWLRKYIKERYSKPGNVYVGVVSRLDSPVTGVVLFARTSKAADRLTQQFARGEPIKLYWAVVEHQPDMHSGSYADWLLHDDARRRVVVTSSSTPKAKEARLSFQVLSRTKRGSLLEVQLHTGRKHQIRVQLAHHGFPILGDKKYGSSQPFASGIALHARRLELLHPVRQTPLILEAALPTSWKSLDIGG